MRIYRIRKFPTKLVLLILITLTIALNPKILLGLKNFTSRILIIPFKFFSGVKTRFVRAGELSEENLALKQRLATLSVELARMKNLSSENKRLQGLLGFKKGLRYKTVAAKVIGRDSADWRSAIILNKGKKDGIREGMSCATAEGVVGSVIEAGPVSSKVMLIADPNSRVGVILESSRESGALTGSSQAGLCKVIYLSLDAKIKKGDRVLTAGFSVFFPKGLRVGKVVATGIDQTNMYKYAIVDPFVDMGKIEEVVCIDTPRF